MGSAKENIADDDYRYFCGDWVKTVVPLDDDHGEFLKVGTRGQIHELPGQNDGMYSIAVGYKVYDVLSIEITPLILPQDYAWKDALILLIQGHEDGLQALKKSLDLEGSYTDVPGRAFFVAMRLMDADQEKDALHILQTIAKSSPYALRELWTYYDERGINTMARKVAGDAVRDGILATPMQRPGIFFNELQNQDIWKREEFSWVPEFEKLTPIVQEFITTLENAIWEEVGGDHRDSGQRDKDVLRAGAWTEYVFFGQGKVTNGPIAEAIQSIIPDAVEMARLGLGEIILSRMCPGTIVAPHCAPSNTRLTAHLGIRIPKKSSEDDTTCAICINGRWHSWEEGKVLIFDDSYEHEVRNQTLEERVVLLVRFWHPQIPRGHRSVFAKKTKDIAEEIHQARNIPPVRPKVRARISGQIPCGYCGDKEPAHLTCHPKIPTRFLATGRCGHVQD